MGRECLNADLIILLPAGVPFRMSVDYFFCCCIDLSAQRVKGMVERRGVDINAVDGEGRTGMSLFAWCSCCVASCVCILPFLLCYRCSSTAPRRNNWKPVDSSVPAVEGSKPEYQRHVGIVPVAGVCLLQSCCLPVQQLQRVTGCPDSSSFHGTWSHACFILRDCHGAAATFQAVFPYGS